MTTKKVMDLSEKKEGLISQPLMVYNLLRKVVGGENSDLPSVRLEKK